MLTETKVDYTAGLRSLEHEVEHAALPVAGALPPWLTGSLVRTGPARFEVGGRSVRHWFDGLAMVHRFAFDAGEVSYSNRFLRTKAFEHAERTGKIGYSEFATDPCRSLFGRAMAAFSPKLTDNGAVNVVRLGGETLALTETPLPVAFEPDTLRTLGVTGWAKKIPGQITIAHPHYDFETGEMLSYAAHLGPRSHYRLYTVKPGGDVRVIGNVPVDKPAYMHSFGLTERYAVLTEWPLVVNPVKLALSGRPFIENYEWQPERGTRYTVIDRRDGSVRARVDGPARFGFHHVNAFERGSDLVLDISTFDDPSIIDMLYLDRMRAGMTLPDVLLTRHTVPLDGGDVTIEPLAEPVFELGRINYRRNNTREYRYAWGASNRDGEWLDAIVKVDVTTGEHLTWREDGCYPGEPVFVPEPAEPLRAPASSGDRPAREDQGALLSIVLDAKRETSYLLVLDAATLSEIARAEVPHAIPFHFHGDYLREV